MAKSSTPCSACGENLPYGSPSCAHCGQANSLFCTACGTRLLQGAAFCHGCGTGVAPQGRANRPLPPAAIGPVATEPTGSAVFPVHDVKRARGARKHVTALFLDIVGSTRILAALDPEDARREIDTVLAVLRQPIERRGGVVVKTLGDGIFAVFGAPLALENHAYLACDAAVEIQSLMPTLHMAGGHKVRVRIGINSGVAVVQSKGSGDDLWLDVVGDVVNRAAHLEARSAPGGVLIGTGTRRLAGHALQMRAAEAMQGGKGSDQEAWELIACRPLTGPILLELGDLNAPFIGRRRERAFIESMIDDLRGGRGDILSIIGDAGSGKTRLIAECLRPLDPATIRVIAVRSTITDRTTPNALLRRVLAGLLAIDEATTADAYALRRALAAYSPELESGAEALAWMLNGDEAESPNHDHFLQIKDAERRRVSALGSVGALLTTLAAERPLVLALDDYQWCDPSSRRFFDEVAALSTQSALLFLFSMRDDHDPQPGRSHQLLRLSPLQRSEMLDLLDGSAGLDALPDSIRDRILDRCEGNPLFLVEIARNVLEASAAAGIDGDKIGEDFPVPDSVADLFEERIDRIEEEDRRALQIISAFEASLDAKVLAELLGSDVASAEAALQHLHGAGLIRQVFEAGPKRYTVGNPIIAKAAYRSLMREERHAIHSRICDVLPTLHNIPLRSRAIARHAYRCGRDALSSAAFLEAGRHALARLSYAEGVELLRSALRANERCEEVSPDLQRLAVDIRIELRKGLFPSAAFEEIDSVLAPALIIAEMLGEPARVQTVRRLQVSNLMALGRLNAALPQAKSLVASEVEGTSGYAESMLMLVQLLASLGHYREALTTCEKLLDVINERAEGMGALALSRSLSCTWALWCASEVGCFDDMTIRMLQAQADLDPEQPVLFRVLASVGTGLFWLRYGEVELAADTFSKALPLTEDDCTAAWFPALASPYGLALLRLGQPEEAIKYLQAAVDRTPFRGGMGRGQRLAHLAQGYLALGEVNRAEVLAREGVEISRRSGEGGVLAHSLRILADILTARQDPAAEVIRQEAVDLARRLGMGSLEREIIAAGTSLCPGMQPSTPEIRTAS